MPNIVRIIARLNVGGPAKHVTWLTAAGAANGFNTTLVTGVVPPGEADMAYFAAECGVEPVTINNLSREITLKDLFVIHRVYKLLKQHKPSIVHTHTAKAGTVGRIACFLYRWLTFAALLGRPRPCKVVHTYHGHIFHSYYGRLKTRLFRLIEQLLARFATDRIVVISKQQLDEIHSENRIGNFEQYETIPLGLDLAVFQQWHERRSAGRAELSAGDDEILVGIVGRLTEIKNHRLFLRAASLYNRLHRARLGTAIRFLVIGDGHLRMELQQFATRLDLVDSMTFLGTRSDPETFYPALDVVALTSLNEGTPLSIIEGMANARACISTNVGGVTDLFGAVDKTAHTHGHYQIHRRGISCYNNDPLGFAAGLAHLVAEPSLQQQLAADGEAFVRSNYSKDRLIKDVFSLYDRMLTAA